MKDQFSKPAQFLDQLNDTKDLFLILISEAPEPIWDLHLEGESWTIKEEMVHIVQVVQLISKGIKGLSRGKTRSFLNVIPRGFRSWINGTIIIPWKARKETKESICSAYQLAHEELVSVLINLKPEDWEKGMPFPKQFRTVSQLAYRPVEHFREHEAHIRRLIKLWNWGS
jgi:hypothetical protein